MTYEDAQAFIATADSRETSRGIMYAITQFSEDAAEAESIWEDGIDSWDDLGIAMFLIFATDKGNDSLNDLYWGGLKFLPPVFDHDAQA